METTNKNKKNKCIHNKRKEYCREGCGGGSICEHNKIRSTCKECRGGAICEHNKIRSHCKECGGGSICEHNKIRSHCKECGGGSICEHNKIRTSCKECGGGSICEHNKIRSICKECEGGAICEHNKIRSHCKECGGGSICEHNKIRSYCKECKGGSICEHNKNKRYCKECGGSSYCKHGIKKERCKEGCGGSAYCKHDKRKDHCAICNPSISCQICKINYTNKIYKCYPLCKSCFCNKYPDHEKSTLYKIKERYLRDELRLRFPNNDITMLFDRKVEDGCSSRKPDVLIDCLTHCIIIECDENQHKSYKCEERRTNELYLDLGDRPLIMIRFNPDRYIYKNNIKVEGCFKPLTKIEDIYKKKFYDINKEEWKRRVDMLVEELKKYLDLNTFPDVLYKEVKLFYDEN
jgi:hypothetical protein